MDETPGIIMKDKSPNVLNSTKKHHKQIKKEILFAFFFQILSRLLQILVPPRKGHWVVSLKME